MKRRSFLQVALGAVALLGIGRSVDAKEMRKVELLGGNEPALLLRRKLPCSEEQFENDARVYANSQFHERSIIFYTVGIQSDPYGEPLPRPSYRWARFSPANPEHPYPSKFYRSTSGLFVAEWI